MYNRKEYFAMGKVFVHGLGQTPESWNARQLEIVSGAGHEVNVETPDKLGKLLSSI